MGKSVRLQDIADMIGVSAVTVSKALSGQKGVSEETRERIRAKADELGYRQPSAIRRMHQERQYMIGVLIAARYEDRQVSFYWKMYRELSARALQKGLLASLEMISQEDEDSGAVPTLLTERRVDGFILLGPVQREYLQRLVSHTDIPMVCLDGADPKHELDCVITDNYFGMYRMTLYLLERGHRKLCYVGTIGSTESITDRYFGFCKAMQEFGLPVDPGRQVIKDRALGDGLTEGYEIQLPAREEMPTAFVCNCDRTAARVVGLLEERGWRVPEDVSVVGFDHYLYPGLCDVKLTTYEVDMKEMTGRALNILRHKIEREYYKKGVHIVEGLLVEEESVRAVVQGTLSGKHR